MQCLPVHTFKDAQSRRVTPSSGTGIGLSEAFPATTTDAGAVGFVLALIGRCEKPLLWVQDRLSQRESGRPYLPGLRDAPPIIRVDLSQPIDVLWAMEEGLRCGALAGVIGEVWGDPAALSFTATKRLALRAEAMGLPCWLLRRATAPNLSAARNRWRVSSLPSAPHPHDARAPGGPRWDVELFRSRHMKPGRWVAHHDPARNQLDMSPWQSDGAAPPLRAVG
ncbi:MAG: hypothetical protein AAFU59_06525 [Pseudomonadota bacterium]